MTGEHEEPADERTVDAQAARPDNIPEKFWDPRTGSVRVDALADSYSALERKFSSVDSDRPNQCAPENAAAEIETDQAEFEIAAEHGMFDPHPELNALLRDSGFTQDQAQLVYDLAAHVLLPALDERYGDQSAEAEEHRLAKHFGGAEKWNEMRRQLRVWGERHLPPAAFESLSSTYDGVLALHRLMAGDEPSVLRGETFHEHVDQGSLRRIIRDPRYWRDRDPAVVRKVSEGFKRLYPDDR